MTPKTTAEFIAEARVICENATPGPWKASKLRLSQVVDGHRFLLASFVHARDAAFIWLARQALPEALDRLAELDRLFFDMAMECDMDKAYRETVEAELSSLRAESLTLRGIIDTLTHTNEAALDERDNLRAENAELKAIPAAAEAYMPKVLPDAADAENASIPALEVCLMLDAILAGRGPTP